MPFYWRFKDKPGIQPSEPPGLVPFSFDFDRELNLFIERRSPELTGLLDDIYSRHANVGFLQDGHSLVNTYGADFWRFLSELISEHPVRSVLEVGCGGCVLLERLREEGCRVLGIDPSPFAAEAGKRKGIEVIQDFFPSPKLDWIPDLIFQVDVLEHIESPLIFLRAQADYLKPGGMIVVNVPDCTRSLERGDVSMALHQHVNMFDMTSLTYLFKRAGLELVKLERSRYGAALYCAARKTSEPIPFEPDADILDRWDKFARQAELNIKSFGERVVRARESGDSIGFFMPQRAFPYLGTIDWFEGFRVFDNMNMWHRRYLDGLDIPVENQEDLVRNPVQHLFVMSLTFGQEVAQALRKDVPGMRVTTLDEILI
jgi:SAM-dependent methyltransferase